MINIVFHGQNASNYLDTFREALQHPATITRLPDTLENPADIAAFANAEVIVGNHFNKHLPRPARLGLFQSCATGIDRIDLAALPRSVAVCNCYGHGEAMAEFVMAAMLSKRVPLADADAKLRQGVWRYRSGDLDALHGEVCQTTLGLLGYGHIAQAIAERAKPFGMRVLAANRSEVAVSACVDAWHGLDDLDDFYRKCDFIVVSLPLTDRTQGMVDARALSLMRPQAVIINVGRGPVIEEQALYDALSRKAIGGAVIDTWYRYPAHASDTGRPASLPFEKLDNVLMTPHMSAWTDGTIRRRGQAMAANVDAYCEGQPLAHEVRPSASQG